LNVKKRPILAHFSSPTKGVHGGSTALSRVEPQPSP